MTTTEEQNLSRRIKDQKRQIRRRKEKYSRSSIGEWYWGRSIPPVWGMGTNPNLQVSLLSQLLLTPKLIVDIWPVPDEQFIKMYGVKHEQMYKLAQKGFLIPNFYHFKADGWRNYIPFSKLAAILADYGRTNTLWIKEYLETICEFSDKEDEYAKFLNTAPLSITDKENLIKITGGRTPNWESFIAAYSQRFAYLDALGGDDLALVVEKIKWWYNNPENCWIAIKALNATKSLVASKTTAAFGGIYRLQPDHLEDIRIVYKKLRELAPAGAIPPPELNLLPEETRRLVLEVAEKSKYVKDRLRFTGTVNQTTTLNDDEFNSYIELLGKIKDGRLGNMMDALAQRLVEPDSDLDPTIDGLRELLEEIDGQLISLRPFALQLKRFGNIPTQMPPEPPTDTPWKPIFMVAGLAVHCVAEFIENAEMAPLLRRKHPLHLYGQWRHIKRSLGIQNWSGND